MRKEFGNHFSTEILYGEILRAMLSVTANFCPISPYDELTRWPAGVQCYIMMVTWISSVTCHTLWRLAVTRVTGVTVKSQIIIRHHLILAEQQWYSQISNMQWTLYTWSVRGLHITADSTSKLGFAEEPENQKTLLEWGPIDPSSVKMDPDSGSRLAWDWRDSRDDAGTCKYCRDNARWGEVWWNAGSGGHWGLHPALGSRATITGHKAGGETSYKSATVSGKHLRKPQVPRQLISSTSCYVQSGPRGTWRIHANN